MTGRNQAKKNYQAIWGLVQQVPRGKVATYGEIAKLAGLLGQARLVGYALHNLPHGINIPWHRVINSKGRISLPKVSGQYESQKRLLEKEGVVFVRDKIDLDKYGWLRMLEG
jgi:methylated-DNA-protein-cysteine methyltransferase-like protein